MASFMDRLKAARDILTNAEDWVKVSPENQITSISPSMTFTNRVSYDSSGSVLAPILTRISIDASNVPLRHVLVDEFGQYKETRKSELNDRISIAANIDQSGVAFIQDVIMKMLQSGAVAMVPIEITSNPNDGSFDILTMRAADITQWYNRSVEVSVYNEKIGEKVPIVLGKDYVAIAYNPFYAVMNEANSTLKRLIDRLALLDVADGKLFSPQLDLIVQLPYALKNERRQDEAQRRLDTIAQQLQDRKYGIAYVDSTEKITQLNRPVTNGLVETVVGLTESLHSQLGLTPSIFNGTASQEEMLLYNNRTILPIIKAVTDAMDKTFFTRTAIRQGNRVMAFPNLFKMAPLSQFAEAADALTRNEIMTSNEVRAAMGLNASKDPEADTLRNKNLNKSDNAPQQDPSVQPETPPSESFSVERLTEGVM